MFHLKKIKLSAFATLKERTVTAFVYLCRSVNIFVFVSVIICICMILCMCGCYEAVRTDCVYLCPAVAACVCLCLCISVHVYL